MDHRQQYFGAPQLMGANGGQANGGQQKTTVSVINFGPERGAQKAFRRIRPRQGGVTTQTDPRIATPRSLLHAHGRNIGGIRAAGWPIP